MKKIKNLKLVALDVDGVALADTFSPVLYRLVQKLGKEYKREVERNLFSQPREKAAKFLIDHFSLPFSVDDLISMYFKERDIYLSEHPIQPISCLGKFLQILHALGLKVVAYGGLDISHFHKELGEFAGFFDGEKYICTNDFRPGIREIVKELYKLEYSEVLFIDDVNLVAEEAKRLRVPFIGVPSNFQHGFQTQDMIATGVRYMVKSLCEVDEEMLTSIDMEISKSSVWN